MKKLAIIGASTNARVIYKFVEFYKLFDVMCFAVDKEYLNSDSFCGLPLISIEDLSKFINKDIDLVFIGVQWNRLNSDRKHLYDKVKKLGFRFANIISPNSIIHAGVELGDNVWIADNVVIETNCQIGSNTFIKSSVNIAESTKIMNHCFIGMRALIAGACYIGEQTFVGVGASVFDEVKVGNKCLIGAMTIIKRNLPDYSLVKTSILSQIVQTYDSEKIENKLLANKNIR